MTVASSMPLVVDGIVSFDPTDHFVWVAIGAFLLTAALDAAGNRKQARYVGTGAWVLFGVFWLTMVPHFYYEAQSPLETILSIAGLPLSVYAGYLLYGGRDSLLMLTRAVGLMGLIYLPFTTIDPLRIWLIETVAIQSHMGMELLGYSPGLEEGSNGLVSRFAFEGYSTYIVLACTGIGSISIFGGLIASVRAPLARKVKAFALAVGVIWILNLARNVFVGLASPLAWFDYPILESITVLFAGESMRTSFFVSHHMISQTLSIVALVGITLLVVRVLPELFDVLDELLFVLTGDEYDLRAELGVDTVRTDGGDE
ncbi:archaeosortase A [Natronoarchaeum sp. GCM10025321]|uniref:archaeosortase A n=2 Tax=unclassified Natronoarchaeum TaxID=2620183 RepID=UPI0036113BD8